MKTTKKLFRKLSLATALLGAAASASAAGDGVDVFTIQGYVNFGATPGPDVPTTYGIASGNSFTGTLTYDSSQPPYYPFGASSPYLAGYRLAAPLISFTVQGQGFSLYSPLVYVFNTDGAGTSWEITTAAGNNADPGFTVNCPWGGFTSGGTSQGNFSLSNSPGYSLPDSSLPTQLDIADWSGEHRIFLAHDFGAVGGVDNGNFYMDAEITSITLAPEPGMVAILVLGAVGCVLFRRRLRGRSL
jgi:hypothetical protein